MNLRALALVAVLLNGCAMESAAPDDGDSEDTTADSSDGFEGPRTPEPPVSCGSQANPGADGLQGPPPVACTQTYRDTGDPPPDARTRGEQVSYPETTAVASGGQNP